jgi:hypothetical protein
MPCIVLEREIDEITETILAASKDTDCMQEGARFQLEMSSQLICGVEDHLF